MNVQLACTLTGSLAWNSDPVYGNRPDAYCLSESGVLLTLDPGKWVGDKGYVGHDVITTIKKPAPAHRELLYILLYWEKNSTFRSIRFATSSSKSSPTSRLGESCTPIIAERSQTFIMIISAVVALHFYAAG